MDRIVASKADRRYKEVLLKKRRLKAIRRLHQKKVARKLLQRKKAQGKVPGKLCQYLIINRKKRAKEKRRVVLIFCSFLSGYLFVAIQRKLRLDIIVKGQTIVAATYTAVIQLVSGSIYL